MNNLSTEKRIQILNMLVESSSMRSISRIVGVSINTVTKLLVDAGRACETYFNSTVRNVSSRLIECDEIWAFCYAKQKRVDKNRIKGDPDYAGNVWLWTAFDPQSKLIVSYMTSDSRGEEPAFYFMQDLRRRLAGRVQISTDGLPSYTKVTPTVFNQEVDFAQIVKQYEGSKYVGADITKVCGNPRMERVSTTLMERHNLTTRMSLRRYTRKTNAHSKKMEHRSYALSLYFVWYNFCRVHSTINTTPAVQAGLTPHVFDMQWILNLIRSMEILGFTHSN